MSQDKSQLKTQGLAFGQAFQTVFKITAMYSVDHPAAEKSVQHSWNLLAPLLKQTGQFKFGFMNQRVLLNSSLATQSNITHLEVEFAKREIAAVTFQAGVTLKDYKRALAVLSTRPAVIQERGGIQKFLAANPIENVKISPAVKPKEDESGMIEVGMDMDSLLTAKAILAPESGVGAAALDMLMEAAGVKKTQGVGENPQELAALAALATHNTVANPEGDLTDMLAAMTQLLSGMSPDSLLASLPQEKQAKLRGQPMNEVATDLMEDAIAGWATQRLETAAKVGSSGIAIGPGSASVVDRDVLQGLMRGLKATRIAERLLNKLGQFIEQANLPKEVYERIRREVVWFTHSPENKYSQLLSLQRFTPQDFNRLVQFVQEAMGEGKVSEATEASMHYFSTWEKAPSSVRVEELKHTPDLLHALASVQTVPLMHTLAEPLLREIMDDTHLHWPSHNEATHCLSIVAQNAGRFEDFEFVHKIASDLKRFMARRPGRHNDCCGQALAALLTPEALDRLIDSFLQRRSDAAWVHTATSLLTMVGPLGAEAAHRRLDDEPAASNRLPLVRLIRGMGPSAIDATVKRLSSTNWEAVRSASYILGDLGDPELPTHLRDALRHLQFEVQQAAVTAILKSNVAGRGQVLAEALPHLQAGVLEMALDELTVLKDPASVGHLEALVLSKKDFKGGVLEKAVIALGAVPSDRAAEALYKVVADVAQPLPVRRAALGGLYNHASAKAGGLVSKLSNLPSNDPLASEVSWNFPTR